MGKELTEAAATQALVTQIAEVVENARQHVITQVNTTMVCTYYEIGRIIVEHEQRGKKRASYLSLIHI